MESIFVRCKMCKHAMKFSAEKAGKRAKCPKCDTIVVIKAEEEAKKPEPETAVAAGAPEAVAAGTPGAAPAQDDDDEYGSTAGYGVTLDPELEERRKALEADEKAKKKKDRKKLPKMGRKVKAIPDAEAWDKVRIGLLFTGIGVWIWFACHLLQGSYVLLGMAEFSEFAVLIAENWEGGLGGPPPLPDRQEFWDVDLLDVYLTMIAGRGFAGFARICITLASVLYFFQALLWVVGYSISLPVPRRFGMLGQLISSYVFAFFNLIFQFCFKLLPVLGAVQFVLIPFLVPEIAMTEYNMERRIPIQLMWTQAPFWTNFLNLVLLFSLYLQPAFGTIFIWSMGIAIKDEVIESGGKGLSEMCLGTMFILLTYHLLSMCGASPVLVLVLRVVYTLWYCFLLLFILRYALLIQKCRAILYSKINPKNELEDE